MVRVQFHIPAKSENVGLDCIMEHVPDVGDTVRVVKGYVGRVISRHWWWNDDEEGPYLQSRMLCCDVGLYTLLDERERDR